MKENGLIGFDLDLIDKLEEIQQDENYTDIFENFKYEEFIEEYL